ncbi:MAG: hypothetical protein EOM11_05725 [Erysipelotrichia bacterium]|nr:hypothetical protein [Erysipelotrichia bacterium]
MRIFLNTLNKRYKKGGLRNPTQRQILKFSENEWLQFASLLERGYTLAQTLELLGHSLKEEILLNAMQEKQSIQELLLQDTKGKFHHYLTFFIKLHSLSDAIYSAIHMLHFEKELRKQLYKKTAYPLFIFVLSFFTIYIFSNYVIPQLLSSFDASENNTLYQLLNIIKYSSTTLLVFVLIFLFFLFCISKSTYFKQLFYTKVAYRIGLCKDYIAYYLSGYLKTLHERGLSSRQSMQFLCSLEGNDYLVNTILTINQRLSAGTDLMVVIKQCPYLSERFKMNFMIATHNGEFEKTLASYMLLQQEKWFLFIKRIGIIVQSIAYIFIGILVICVYQIMLIPLQMIEGM